MRTDLRWKRLRRLFGNLLVRHHKRPLVKGGNLPEFQTDNQLKSLRQIFYEFRADVENGTVTNLQVKRSKIRVRSIEVSWTYEDGDGFRERLRIASVGGLIRWNIPGVFKRKEKV
jgi:hypothetical protein